MASGEAARGWTDLFKRSPRPDDAAALVAVASPAELLITSKVFPRFLAALAQAPAPVLLDLGPVVGPNIAFFGERLSCKIYIEDLYADIEDHARRDRRDALATFFATRLTLAPASVDGILCWDLFDYLDTKAGKVLGSKLGSLLRKGGALYGCFGTTAVDLRHYTRNLIESDDTLRPRPFAATPVRRNVLLTRDIIKLFNGLIVSESILLRTSTRETLFRKPGDLRTS